MAKISKEEIALLKEMIADPSVPNDEKDLYRETLSQFVEVKEVVEKKTPTKRKTTARKKTTKKPKPADIDKAKAEILKRTGKTEEECEKIIDEYKELRRKSVTRKKKETTQKEKAKKRTTKLKKEGKTIEGTTEKNVEATLDTATEKVVTKIDKEVEKIEKTSKTEKQVAKKINTLVSKAVKSNKKLLSDTAKELAKVDPNNAKQYLMSIKKEIDTLLKKYEYGGEIFDGTGDVVDYGAGGYTQPYNIQEGLISTGNNVQFAKGGLTDERNKPMKKFSILNLNPKNPRFPEIIEGFDDYSEMTNYIQREGLTANDVFVTNNEEDREIYPEELYANGGYLYNQALGRYENPLFRTGDKIPIMDNRSEVDNDGNFVIQDLGDFIEVQGVVSNPKGEPKIINDDYTYFVIRKRPVNDMGGVEIVKDTPNRMTQSQLLDLQYKVETTPSLEKRYQFLKELPYDKEQAKFYAKGGKTQGYDDRLDDSLGMRTGRRSTKEQDYKDRRDESKGMEKGMGRRPYSSVGTMDMENRMMLQKGGRLYDDLQIDKGAFRKEAMKRNISTTELMNKVLDNENRYSMKMVKQARLMKNMRK